jgi:hypothetical protein
MADHQRSATRGSPETPDEWRDRHVRIAEHNLEVLRAGPFRFQVRKSPDGLLGASVLFREHGKPRVDFFLSTGRWRVVGAGASRLMSGHARAFLAWYAKQEVPRAG